VRPCLDLFVTSPVGAVTKYCDKYVCACVSVCLSVREHISGTTRAIFTKFLCMLPMVMARPPLVGWRNPKGKGQFWGLSGPFKSIGYLRCSRRCRVRCKRDHSIANNVMQQKGSFIASATRNPEHSEHMRCGLSAGKGVMGGTVRANSDICN